MVWKVRVFAEVAKYLQTLSNGFFCTATFSLADEEDRNLAGASPGEGDTAATVPVIVNNFHSKPNVGPLRQPHLIKTCDQMSFPAQY